VEVSLPTPVIHLHIAIEVIGRLRLAQEMRSLSDKEFSLVDFLLDQISLLKEVVEQQGGGVPLIVTELLGNRQVTPPSDPTPDHQPSLVCPILKLGNTKSCIGRFPRSRAHHSPLGHSYGMTKRGSVGCGKHGGLVGRFSQSGAFEVASAELVFA
jgi:hypothetical protein